MYIYLIKISRVEPFKSNGATYKEVKTKECFMQSEHELKPNDDNTVLWLYKRITTEKQRSKAIFVDSTLTRAELWTADEKILLVAKNHLGFCNFHKRIKKELETNIYNNIIS